MGITASVAGILTDVGIGAGTAADIAGVAVPALTNAAIGTGLGALTGNPGLGAALGGISGAFGPLSQLIGGPLGGGAPGGALSRLLSSSQSSSGTSTMDDGSVIPTGNSQRGSIMDDGSVVPSAAAAPAAAAARGANSGGGLGSTLAILTGLMQNAAKPSTTAPVPPGSNSPFNPTGALNRQAVQGFTPSTGSYYTYGQQAEPAFFQGNQIHLAHGGALSQMLARSRQRGGMAGGGAFSTGGGQNQVTGHGGGQEDNVPARLSPKEYVVDATTMSRLGDGNPDEGAKKMDEFRHLVARDSGSKQVVQHPTRSPLQYLKKVA